MKHHVSPDDDISRDLGKSMAALGLVPRAFVLDKNWAQDTLDSILADDQSRPSAARRTRKPRRLTLAVGAIALVATGSAAYATVGVPPFVSNGMRDLSRVDGSPYLTHPRPDQIANILLPDGSRFAAWRDIEPGLQCDASVDDWTGQPPTGWSSFFCAELPQGSDTKANLYLAAWTTGGQAAPHHGRGDADELYPVVYGTVPDGAAAFVRITGTVPITNAPVDVTVPVNPSSRGFGALLPSTIPGVPQRLHLFDDLTVTMLDSLRVPIGSGDAVY